MTKRMSISKAIEIARERVLPYGKTAVKVYDEEMKMWHINACKAGVDFRKELRDTRATHATILIIGADDIDFAILHDCCHQQGTLRQIVKCVVDYS